jgi:hypothetical protein
MTGAQGEELEAQAIAPADVEIRSRCICPGGNVHPDGGEVFVLPARLGFRQLTQVTKSMQWLKTERPGARVSEVLAELSEAYVRYCLASWTLTSRPSPKYPKGEPIELTPDAVDVFLLGPDTADVAQEIAEVADNLYAEAVLGPLVRRGSELSEAGQTAGSISPNPTNGASRKPSTRSSTGHIPTAVTVRTQ